MRLLFLAVLVVCASGRLGAQPAGAVALSERVGTTIDSLEREYFGLFPQHGNVTSAHARRGENGELTFVVERKGQPDTLVTLSASVERDVRRFIEERERYESEALTYVYDAGAPFRMSARLRDVATTRFEFLNGDIVEGILLHVDDRGAIVWRNDGEYDWRTIREHAVAIDAASIDRVVGGGSISRGVIVGAAMVGTIGAFAFVFEDDRPEMLPIGLVAVFGGVLGGTIGSLSSSNHAVEGDVQAFRQLVPQLAERRLFIDAEPPEVRELAAASLLAPPLGTAGSDADRSFGHNATRRLSVAALITAPGSDAGTSYVIQAPNKIIDSSRSTLVGFGVSLESTYDLATWLDIGVAIDYRGASAVDGLREREYVSELGGTLMVDANLMPRRVLGRQEMEVLLGLGAGASRMSFEGTVQDGLRTEVQSARMVTVVPNALARVQLRMNVSDRIAVQLGMVGKWYGTFEVDEYAYQFPTTSDRGRVVKAHEIPLSSLFVQAGARYWF